MTQSKKKRFDPSREYCCLAWEFVVGKWLELNGWVVASTDAIYLVNSGQVKGGGAIGELVQRGAQAIGRAATPEDIVAQVKYSELSEEMIHHEDWPLKEKYGTFDLPSATTYILQREWVERVAYPWWGQATFHLSNNNRIGIKGYFWHRGKILNFLKEKGWLDDNEAL